ncbi:MAG TPA: transposase [Opitutaceae bacterium]|nr:transposase [Opitutaceae bacterium]
MARKLRLEFPGACYHVINRGNYRSWVFRDEKTKAAFETCLFKACGRCQWRLHAFVIMGNHYHLAVETPLGNLVAGMQWLQATFANRFNRLRNERGHLFQGRFKALLVEPGEALGQVCHYLHLNPVRAGIVPVERLAEYRHSSYWFLGQPKARPACLDVTTALAEAGQLADTPAGWRTYADFLRWQAADGPAGKSKAYVNLSRGWAIGTAEFKTALVKEHRLAAEARAWEGEGADEMRQLRWRETLSALCAAVPASAKEDTAKSAPWKVAVAARMRAISDVRNDWLAEHLSMGSGIYVSKHVGRLRSGLNDEAAALAKRLEKVKGKT